ncbi:hypothetical protein GCM10022284_64530 [Streptomyces hundungensis]
MCGLPSRLTAGPSLLTRRPSTAPWKAVPALCVKEKALARAAPVSAKRGRYRPGDTILAFLDGL